MEISVYNQKGEELKKIQLPEEIFGLKINADLLKQAYLAQKNNSRAAISNTKTRKDVRGGGKKPWKQKGTGRARAGSIRSPLWRGGGTVFGPASERNYSQKINKKMKRKAILMALSSKVSSKELFMVDDIKIGKIAAREAKDFLKNISVFGKKTLIAQHEKNDAVVKSFRNIPEAKTILAKSLNVADLMDIKNLVLTENSINVIRDTFVK